MGDDAADALVLLARAFELQQAGRLADAEAAYATILARTPDDPTALVNAGAVAFARGEYPLAVARFERVLRRAPANALVLANLGMALIGADRAGDALVALERAIAAKPTLAQAHNNRGIALVRLGRAADAIAAFERALELEPRYLEAALNLGEQCNAAGDAPRARAAFDRALALDASHVGARIGRAFAQALEGDLDGATAALAAITAAHPENAAAWQTEGAVRNWAWDHEGAERAYRASLRAAPDSAEAAFGVAATLLARGRYDEGWAAFERRPDTAAAIRFAPRGAAGVGRRAVRGHAGGPRRAGLRRRAAVRALRRRCACARGTRRAAAGRRTARRSRRCSPRSTASTRWRSPRTTYAPMARSRACRCCRCRIGSASHATRSRGACVTWRRLRRMPRRGASACAMSRRPGWASRGRCWRAPTMASSAGTSRCRWRCWRLSWPPPASRSSRCSRAPQATRPGSARWPRASSTCAPHLADFADTAALVDTLDLVICADTAVAHLAGALGRAVWMLDRSNSCWRWRTDAGAASWYPTLTVFRQHRFGDWTGVTRKARRGLRRVARRPFVRGRPVVLALIPRSPSPRRPPCPRSTSFRK